MNARKSLAITAVAAVAALGLAACSSNGGGTETPTGGATTADGGTGGDSGTLTVWENNTNGDLGTQFWGWVQTEYAKVQPGITLNIVPVQNEDMDGKLQTSLGGADAPNAFFQAGGGKLAAQVEAGYLAEITDGTTDIPDSAYAAHEVDGKKYAMPMTVLPGGIFYSKDLFEQAGITTPPTTIEELNDAVTKLKAIGVAPIALGAKDSWPAAHWFYWFALRVCSQDTLADAAANADLSDPCFLKAGEALQTFAGTKPFNDGFLTTSAQQGAGSSAGLLANHLAAMELMGAWEPGVVGSLTPDQKNLPDLGFFPFPAVEGGAGDPSAMMGGVDAFSCTSGKMEKECLNFLNFLGSTDVQSKYATLMSAPPANTKAAAAVTDPLLQQIQDYYGKAAYVSLWLDTRLGSTVGDALNAGVVDMLGGSGSPQAIIDGVKSAVDKG